LQALNETKQAKKKRAAPEGSRAGEKRSSGEGPETVDQKPKRRTQSQLRVCSSFPSLGFTHISQNLLEKAFVGEADDIFETKPLSHPALTSTPRRDPLRSSSLHAILSVKSPHDLPAAGDFDSDSESQQAKRRKSGLSPEGEAASHWEASYVNKMKKQQRTNRGKKDPHSANTSRRQSQDKRGKAPKKLKSGDLTESSEFTVQREGGRRVEASLNGRGKVTISVRQRDDDDSENEEMLRALVARQGGGGGGDSGSSEEEEWDE
jgi:hypothetical protein